MLRHFILLGGFATAFGLCGATSAAESAYPCPTAAPSVCPCPSNQCVPNVATFGYFQTKWRTWPGEQRQEIINPRSIGREVIPTPKGHEQLPAPPMAVPSQEGPSGVMPPGELLPPGGAILPPDSATPSEGMQGLPTEPGPEVLPGMPGEETPKDEPKQDVPAAPTSDRGRSGNLFETLDRPATAASPFERRNANRGNTVVFLAESQTSAKDQIKHGAHQADSIDSLAPVSPMSGVQTTTFVATEPNGPTQGQSDVKLGPPAVGVGGYCPVELTRDGRWTQGDERFSVTHSGLVYRMAGPAQMREFAANPEAFIPAYSGNDPVVALEECRAVPGSVMYCATYDGRLYMFSGSATQARFNKDPQRYAVVK